MRTKVSLIFLHLIVWLAVYLLPYLVTYGKISMAIIFGEPGGLIHAISTALLVDYAYFNHYLLVPYVYLPRKYFAYAASVLACILIVIWLPGLLRELKDIRPAELPSPELIHHPGNHPPAGTFKLSYNVILFVICTFVSISIRQQKQLLEAQKEKLSSELSFLKAQINPHFLFNTLNSIYALSIRKSDDTPKAVIELSELMRYILKDSDEDTVLLDRELGYVNNYIALQRRRLGNTVQIQYVAPAPVGNLRVAPLIIMSFVENAFKHGVNPDQDSAINISITLEGKQLHLIVTNSKVSSVHEHETMGIGLKNAASRLKHLYPAKHKLTIEDNENTFSVNLILKLDD